MAIVGEPCNVDLTLMPKFLLYVVPTDVCTHALYPLTLTVQLYSTFVHTTWAQYGHIIVMNRAGIFA